MRPVSPSPSSARARSAYGPPASDRRQPGSVTDLGSKTPNNLARTSSESLDTFTRIVCSSYDNDTFSTKRRPTHSSAYTTPTFTTF